jgi:hypothetical protein
MAVSSNIQIHLPFDDADGFLNVSLSVACTTAIVGFIIASATTNTGARYFSIFVFTTGVYAISGINLGWVASTCGQTKEKRAVSLAVTNTISNIATIYTPVSPISSSETIAVVNKSSSTGGRRQTGLDT